MGAVKKSTLQRTQPSIPKVIEADVRVVAIESVKLWSNNPRSNDDAVPRLAEIIRKHGQRTPVVVDAKTGVVYKGNTTLKAMKLLGHKTIRAQFEYFASEQAAVAYGIADNKSSEWAEWDEDLLLELMSVRATPQEWSLAGFSEEERKALLLEPSLADLNKIKENVSGLKDKTIIVVSDAEQKPLIKEMLVKWLKVNNVKAEVR